MAMMIEPADLTEVFQALQEEDLDAVIVGGQAVNLWASRYSQTEPELRQYLPFASQDLDFYGGRVEAALCGEILGGETILNSSFDPSPNAGVVLLERAQGRLRIDFLASVYGLNESEIMETAIPFRLGGEGNHRQMRVLHPVLCLEGKLSSLRGLPQAGRQDLKHLRISICCVRAFLKERLPQFSARAGLKLVERVLSSATREDGLRAWYDHEVCVESAVPKEILSELTDEKWQRFSEIRLPQIEDRIAAKRTRYARVMENIALRKTERQHRTSEVEES